MIPVPPIPPSGRKVSVVITAFNQPAYLPRAAASVAAQSHGDWEAVIVDDGSTDGKTPAMCDAVSRRREMQGRTRVLHTPNGRVSLARNRGMAAADVNAPFILFLDADDELVPEALETLVACLERAPEAIGAFGRPVYVDDQNEPVEFGWQFNPSPAGHLLTFDEAYPDPMIFPPAAFMVRRWAAAAVGGFDAAMLAVEDRDFLLRLMLIGPMAAAGKPTALYRRHSGNVSDDIPFVQASSGMVYTKEILYRQARAFQCDRIS